MSGEENAEPTTESTDPGTPPAESAEPAEGSEAQSVSRDEITDLDFDELDLP